MGLSELCTNYISGPVAHTICQGKMEELLIMDTHGGRPRAIESGDLTIDVAFIVTPQATINGDGNGLSGKSACGVLGYAISDMKYAKTKVAINKKNFGYLKCFAKCILSMIDRI